MSEQVLSAEEREVVAEALFKFLHPEVGPLGNSNEWWRAYCARFADHVAEQFAVPLEAARAEVWLEGWHSGVSDAAAWTRDEDRGATPNPYTSTEGKR